MQYDALSEEAKSAALEYVRQMEQREWTGDYYLGDIAGVLALLGFTVATRTVKTVRGRSFEESDFNWSLGYCQGDGFRFRGRWDATDMNAANLLIDRPQDARLVAIVGQLVALAIRHPQGQCKIINNHYGPGLPSCEVDNIEAYDEDGPQALSDDALAYMDSIVIDLGIWAYNLLRDGYESDMEDAQILSTIEANEWEFVESGEALA